MQSPPLESMLSALLQSGSVINSLKKIALTHTVSQDKPTCGATEWTLMDDGNELIQIKDDP